MEAIKKSQKQKGNKDEFLTIIGDKEGKGVGESCLRHISQFSPLWLISAQSSLKNNTMLLTFLENQENETWKYDFGLVQRPGVCVQTSLRASRLIPSLVRSTDRPSVSRIGNLPKILTCLNPRIESRLHGEQTHQLNGLTLGLNTTFLNGLFTFTVSLTS